MLRIGIDVGGTNTDAVLLEGRQVVGWVKTSTTADVTSGITAALQRLLATHPVDMHAIRGVMIGTTHFTNAVVQRRHLMPTAAVRLGLPATKVLPPMVDWPADLRDTIGNHAYLAHGGHEVDGRKISELNEQELRGIAADIRAKGIRSVSISSVFSPVNAEFERKAAEILAAELPEAALTISSEIGRIGLLERENAAIMNACLQDLCQKTIGAFRQALRELSIAAPLFLTQNDGTLMSADFAEQFPVLTFSSGATNSMRGAAFLSGLKDGIVVDVGGTTTDVGALINGFPREASVAVAIGDVRTNFRMPDVYSFGLGGGSLIQREPLTVGPQSVAFELSTRALIFGGAELTTSDVAVALGRADFGDRSKVANLDADFAQAVWRRIQEMIAEAVDRMKVSAEPLPVIVVGGGSILVDDTMRGASEVVKPDHYPVANAVGAAIAQISGEIEQVFSLVSLTRDEAVAQAKQEALNRAIAAGADPATVEVVDVEDVPLAYLPGNATRIRAKAVGDLKTN
ncbi:MAG: hydantoinase/oxoprolinase family protein [Chloroflexaceae bacterium]|nr:hydantoinase/oxoprolinase family protein [Chloroflexaceae bacterium]